MSFYILTLFQRSRGFAGRGYWARRPGVPAVLVASAGKAIEEMGWRPRYTSLEEIIATAWMWHRNKPGGYSQVYSPEGR
ncbi:hypothetical protein SEF58_09125 [Neomoorella humiferrea]|uniref:hypothetical protein n=1 Tax=Neomoorella humiferrea TaxID=676965 RepID=UPI003D930680